MLSYYIKLVHGSALDTTSERVAELTHINLYDHTVEGLRLAEAGASTVQYHPEAGPGPHDASYLFEEFWSLIERGA